MVHIHALSMHHSVGIIGASGYSGVELTRLLLGHPSVKLSFVTSDRWVGQSIASKISLPSELLYVSNEQGLVAAKGCEVVFLATPAEISLALAPQLRALSVRVVDLAGSFRLQDLSQYPSFYKFEHSTPALLTEAVYGLPELFRAKIRGAQFVANPGCYATAAALSLAPLINQGPAVARLKSGVSAAQVNDAFVAAFGKEPLVRLLPSADSVRLAAVVGTPWCLIGASVDETHVVSVSAIDNLLKGAASQAVQNLNLMLGEEETTGLGLA